ncbi:MFS transporter [Roseibium sp. SCP14]|uniref:MFS transporter n=1 Tax=Roseibium sp. SCP14 TaxID=3141375 RepID=UPI0033398533
MISEKKRQRGLVLAMGGLGGLVMLDESIFGVALPSIRTELDLSPTTAHWIINSYMLAFTCLAAIGGKAIDLFGLRPALIVSASVFAVTSLVAGFAENAAMLISLRVVQGLCAAIIYPMSLAAATLTYGEKERGKAVGISATIATVFLAAGPLLGGVLTEFLSWRWVFWINIPVLAVCVSLTLLLWRPPARIAKRPKVDLMGLILLLAGLTTFIFGLMEGPDFGWSSPFILGPLVIGALGLGGFFRFELKQKTPLIDVQLFFSKSFHTDALIVLLTQMTKIVVVIFVPHFLQLELSFSALWAGFGIIVAVLPYPFLAEPAGRIADRYGTRRPVLTGLTVLALTNVLIGVAIHFESYWGLAPALLVWGVAVPFTMLPATRSIANSLPLEKQGEFGGLVMTARLLGGTLGVTLGSVLLAMETGSTWLFWVMAAIIATCCAYGAVVLEKETEARA